MKKKVSNYIEKINQNKILKDIISYVLIIIGAYFISIGINMFLLPHKMSTGGASGIATIFYYISHIPMGVTILVINIPLFLLAIYKLGKKFTIKTIISTILLSIFLDNLKYDMIIKNYPLDLFTSSIFGGLVIGIGLSFTFKAGASSGGSDLLAQIIYKIAKVQSLSQILMIIEFVIILAIILVFKDINLGLYSLVALFISTKVIDIIVEGVYYTKVVTIITKKHEEIIDKILKNLKRSATITNTIGAHSKEENVTITCIVTKPQIAEIKDIVKSNDKDAIMYITTVNEALGYGFKQID